MASPRTRNSIDTRAIGLDAWLAFARWLTGKEHLHYGLWDGIAPVAANTGRAQEAYTELLLSHLPAPGRVLDIGGGAGETAVRLLDLGHSVEIVIPSPLLAARCRENAPTAITHEARFEDVSLDGPFDAILFSESFQYIPMTVSLPACARLLAPGGTLLIADCFRSEAYRGAGETGVVGGGHRLTAFRDALAAAPFETIVEEDLTARVAPSIDLEQELYNVFGQALTRIDAELAEKRPFLRWSLAQLLRLVLSRRRRHRLLARLTEQNRSSEAFCEFNRYLLIRLRRV